ncbi:MAG TPA: TonB-dependent receptor, partial [Terriglobales bacterium]|nr:TonB-dependent receptor [Terriglobales bacterium]
SDDRGKFVASGLPVSGTYTLRVQKPGFAAATRENVDLVGGSNASVTIRLRAAGENSTITVTGAGGGVRADQPQIGVVLDQRQIKATPLLDARITYLPLLNAANRPALTTGDLFTDQDLFTTNGAGRRQAWFEVDGGNSIDMWGRQTIFTNLPVGSVDEMSVLSNSFSAEYGFGVGSAVNIATRTGSNQYHGSGTFLWRPSATSAQLSGYTAGTATSGAQVTGDNLKQGRVNISGPIGADQKTHFFAEGEYSWEDRTSPITSPIAPGSFVGQYRGWDGDARLDHQFNEKNTVFLRVGADSFRDTNPQGTVGGNTLPSAGRSFSRRTYTAEIGETAVISPTLLNNARGEFDLASPITAFDPFIDSTQFQVPIATAGLSGTFTTGTSQSAKLQNHQFEVGDTLSWVRGKHTMKFGADLIHAHTGGNGKEFGGPIYLGQLVYNTCNLDLVTCESSPYLDNIANVAKYTQSYGNSTYTVDDSLWSLFVQDDFHATQKLTLNVGLRYEQQTFTDSRLDFAPRVGFAYNLFGDGKTVLRGGYGIYYSQIPDNQEANYALSGPTGVFNYTAGLGQVGFPTSVAEVPLPAFPPGAVVPVRTIYLRPGQANYYNQFLPVSTLVGYQSGLWNPYSQQWTFGIEHELATNWVLSADYVGSHSLRVLRPLDVDPPTSFIRTAQGQSRSAQAANCTRPYWIWWYQQNGMTCNTVKATNPQPPYALVTSDVNDGYGSYDALDVNLKHPMGRRAQMLVSYTWSHALDNVDPDIPQQNPNDPNFTGQAEYGNAIFDQRHRMVVSGVYQAPWKISLGGVATVASGVPYNITTGTTNSGDNGGTTDRPIVDGTVLRRNAGRGLPIYEVSPFVERPFGLGERVTLDLRAEALNVFNHPNFLGYQSVYGNAIAPPPSLGQPNTGIANQLPARSLQFQAMLSF